jgi:hypothetical protein
MIAGSRGAEEMGDKGDKGENKFILHPSSFILSLNPSLYHFPSD